MARMNADFRICSCRPETFPHECPCLQITLSSHDAWLVATGEPLIKAGHPIPYDRSATLAAWGAHRGDDFDDVPTAEQLAAAEVERELELRSAERRRCQYRSAEPVRTEPCACSTIRLLPIYTCGLHACDCADLRQPQPPARCCLHCPDHSQAGPARRGA